MPWSGAVGLGLETQVVCFSHCRDELIPAKAATRMVGGQVELGTGS
jgi:hypothetical protein